MTKTVSNLYKANIWSNLTIEFAGFDWDSDRRFSASPRKLVYNQQRNYGSFTRTLQRPLQVDVFHSNIQLLAIAFRKHVTVQRSCSSNLDAIAAPTWRARINQVVVESLARHVDISNSWCRLPEPARRLASLALLAAWLNLHLQSVKRLVTNVQDAANSLRASLRWLHRPPAAGSSALITMKFSESRPGEPFHRSEADWRKERATRNWWLRWKHTACCCASVKKERKKGVWGVGGWRVGL